MERAKIEQFIQELKLLEEYLLAVKSPDSKFLRMRAERLLLKIDELKDLEQLDAA